LRNSKRKKKKEKKMKKIFSQPPRAAETKVNLLARIGLRTGAMAHLYDGQTGKLVQALNDPNLLDVSSPSSTGHFATLSTQSLVKMVTVYDAQGKVLGDFASERDTGRVTLQVTAHAQDVMQWNKTGFTVTPFKSSFPKIKWNTPELETLVTVIATDTGDAIFCGSFLVEDPELLIIKRFSVVHGVLSEPFVRAFSVTTTLTAFTAQELAFNPPMGAMATRLLPLNSTTLIVSDSNDDRARLVCYDETHVHSVRLAFDDFQTLSLQGMRASVFNVQSKYLLIGDQKGRCFGWDLEQAKTLLLANNLENARKPSFVFSISSAVASTEWCISVGASDNLIVAVGDESRLVATLDQGKTFMAVQRNDGAIQPLTQLASFDNERIYTSEFEGTNILSGWQINNGTLKPLFSVDNTLQKEHVISKLFAIGEPLAVSKSKPTTSAIGPAPSHLVKRAKTKNFFQ
jgi:hypothetical protein